MNEYKIGSIANLISQSKGIKIKSGKKKDKTKQEKKAAASELFQTKTDKPVIKKKKNKNVSLKETFTKIDIPDTDKSVGQDSAANKRKRKNVDAEITESKSNKKKRKKLVDQLNKSFGKESKSDTSKLQSEIDLNFIPSDSEEDESTEKNKNSKSLKTSKRSEYKDFTDCTVFVGNIPTNYDKQKISKLFSKFGKIQSARIRCVPVADINISKKVAAIKKQFNAKRNSLVAYVKYETQDSANAALEANGMLIDGHHLRVDLAEQNKERDNNKAVFVGCLPFDIEDDELWEFFQNCGKINSVRVIRDSQTSMGKGFGYVNFDSTAAVELAIQMNGQELKKRTINVKRCVKARNKNKMNAFGRLKSKEMTNQLLCKRGKKFKDEKKKWKQSKKQFLGDFQGRQASMKEKKKKKLSKAALRQKKLVKILGATKS